MSARRVETQRIAAQLGVASTELDYLMQRDGAYLTQLRQAIAMSTIERHRHLFERMARASSLLPGAIASRIAEDILGAEMIANLTPFMPAARAAEISARMSIEFQADVAVHMIPESSAGLMAALDPGVRAAVTRELIRRQEFAVMGTLVDYLSVDVIGKLAREIVDPLSLLNITRYVENKARLREVVAAFDDSTVSRMLALAAEHGLMNVLVELAQHLSSHDRNRIRRLREPQTAAVQAWAAAVQGVGLAEDPVPA
jgi:hypothetical protein